MTLADVGVTGWPAESVVANAESLTVNFRSDSGNQKMTLYSDGSHLSGDWREARYQDLASIELKIVHGLQFTTEERIQIDGPAGSLGASIILPESGGPFPGVVFLHGSGPQSRDSSRFAAQILAENGVASLIFDKRGVAESTGEWLGATIEDLASDGIAVAEYMLSHPGVSDVGFFGHSQGGWIGPLAGATWKKTAFVISSAGPAVSPSREAQWDVVRALRDDGAGESAEHEARRIIELWHDGVRSGHWADFDDALESARDADWFEPSGLAWFAERPSEDTAASYRAIMDYDPIPALTALGAPLLALLAPDDESIDSVETELILRNLIAQGQDINLILYPGYDHSMRRLGDDGASLRWPEHPDDYFTTQVSFIHEAASNSLSSFGQAN
jgi:dienelactone hydrolase